MGKIEIFLLLICFIYNVYSQAPKFVKETRALACFSLSRAKNNMDSETDGQKRQEMAIGLVNCFLNINEEQVMKVLQGVQTSQVEGSLPSSEYDKLFDFNSAMRKYSEEDLKKASNDLAEAIQNIQKSGGRIPTDDDDDDDYQGPGFSGSSANSIGGVLSSIIYRITIGLFSSLEGGYLTIFFMLVLIFFLIKGCKAVVNENEKKQIHTQ